jgi:hypothetical protein
MQFLSVISCWRRIALLTMTLAAAAAGQSRARVAGSVETGAATVEQPLVRSGAAFYLAPSVQLTARDVTIGGDAVFAAGTPVWQSFLGNGYVRSPAVRSVRLLGSGQLLKTSGLLSTWHGDVGVEWRMATTVNSGAISAQIGRLRYGGEMWRDVNVTASATHQHGAMLLALEGQLSGGLRPTSLQERLGVTAGTGDTFNVRTLDFTPRMIWERGRMRTDASIALRALQHGVSGTRAGPQLSFTFATTRGISIFAGAAQRLPDVRAGIPSGRSALLGVRVGGARLLSRSTTLRRSGPTLNVVNGMLILDPGITSVSHAALRGDFTEWQPRDCHPRDAHSFYCGTAPKAGTWRVAIRLNDGAWQQPGNLAPAADDFGTVDGLLMTGGKP